MSAGSASPAAVSAKARASPEPPAVGPGERTSGQLALFVTERRSLPAAASLADDSGERTSDGPRVTDSDDRQIELFAPAVVLARDLERALARGQFEEAARLRGVIRETFGHSFETESLGFLDRLDGCLWRRPPGEALSVWTEIDIHLRERTHLRARLRDGVFARLLESHSPETLVEAMPECLAALALVLACSPDASEGGRRARRLVRDALLAGYCLEPLDFDHDEALADVLAEDLPPRWLACLGFIRRLWAPAQPGTDPTAFSSPLAGERSDDEAALEFWHCLQIADNAACADELLHEARRRMKRLQPELHALYMRRAAVRPGW